MPLGDEIVKEECSVAFLQAETLFEIWEKTVGR